VISVTFRLAIPSDAKAIFTMRLESAADLTRKLGIGHWSRESRISSIKERINLSDQTNPQRLSLYVAQSGTGEILGSVCVSSFPPGFWKRQHWLSPKANGLGVFNLVVPPRYQRQGIGSFLMAEVEKLAKVYGIEFVRLDAYTSNSESRSFYQALGYQERLEMNLRGVGLVMIEKRISLCD